MRKRQLHPKVHTYCGNPLTSIYLAEIVPVSYFYLSVNKYIDGELPETIPDIQTEFRCGYCNQVISNGDFEYVMKRIKDNKGVLDV